MKPIPGFEGVYSATESGKIWSHPKEMKGGHKGKALKPWLIGNGYEVVSLYFGIQRNKKFLIHRLVAQAFIPNPKGLPEVNHKNGNRLDNRPENLEWCTSRENKTHAWKTGLYNHKGTNHYLAKLDEKKVGYIRKRQGKESPKETAKTLGVNEATVRDVIAGRTWKI